VRGDNNDKATKTSEWTRQMSFGFHQQSIPCEAAKGIQSRRMVVYASLKMLGRPSEHRLPLEGKGEDGRGRGETWHSDNTFPARCVRPAGWPPAVGSIISCCSSNSHRYTAFISSATRAPLTAQLDTTASYVTFCQSQNCTANRSTS